MDPGAYVQRRGSSPMRRPSERGAKPAIHVASFTFSPPAND